MNTDFRFAIIFSVFSFDCLIKKVEICSNAEEGIEIKVSLQEFKFILNRPTSTDIFTLKQPKNQYHIMHHSH